MALTTTEAKAVNNLLRFLLGDRKPDGQLVSEQAGYQAAELLAGAAFKRLKTGLTTERLATLWWKRSDKTAGTPAAAAAADNAVMPVARALYCLYAASRGPGVNLQRLDRAYGEIDKLLCGLTPEQHEDLAASWDRELRTIERWPRPQVRGEQARHASLPGLSVADAAKVGAADV
jgi:hypothetical protein